MNEETVYFNWEVSCPIDKVPVITRSNAAGEKAREELWK